MTQRPHSGLRESQNWDISLTAFPITGKSRVRRLHRPHNKVSEMALGNVQNATARRGDARRVDSVAVLRLASFECCAPKIILESVENVRLTARTL